MSWRKLAIFGLMKKIFTHETSGAHNNHTEDEKPVVTKAEMTQTLSAVDDKVVMKEEVTVTTITTEVDEKQSNKKPAEETKAEQDEIENVEAKAQPVSEEAETVSEVKEEVEEVTVTTITTEVDEKLSNIEPVAEKKEETAEETENVEAKAQPVSEEAKAVSEVKEEEIVTDEKDSDIKPVEETAEEAKVAPEVVPEVAKKAQPKKSRVASKKKKEAPSKRELKIQLYHEDIMKHLGSVDDKFLQIIVKNLGPSIYNKDAERVDCASTKELATVKNNFLVRKLKLSKKDPQALNDAVNTVCEQLKDDPNKYRATFYYLLAKNLGRESKLR